MKQVLFEDETIRIEVEGSATATAVAQAMAVVARVLLTAAVGRMSPSERAAFRASALSGGAEAAGACAVASVEEATAPVRLVR